MSLPAGRVVDVDRAEQIAGTITDPDSQAAALAGLVEVVAVVDVDRAQRIADRAEQIARTITDRKTERRLSCRWQCTSQREHLRGMACRLICEAIASNCAEPISTCLDTETSAPC
jgi:hypothetical protein